MQNRGSVKRSGRNEALKIPGAHSKSRKHKTFWKEESPKNTKGSIEIAEAKMFHKERSLKNTEGSFEIAKV
jgi:hypothetical protein